MPISASGANGKSFDREPEEVLHLRGREIGGRTAAPVELHHRARAIYVRGHMLDFTLERRQTKEGRTLWSLVMTTLHAQNRHRLSQKGRCMYSETGVLCGCRLRVNVFKIGGAEIILPHGRGGVAGVTRTGAVVARQKFIGDAEALAVKRQSKIGLARVGS